MAADDQDYSSLLSAIDAAEQDAYGSESNSILSEDRARAIEYYLGANTSPAPEGRSQVVSRDVFDTVEWIKPALIRVFAGDDDLAAFEPIGPEDEEQAQQETAYINYVVKQKNPWYQIVSDWMTDALICKTGYALAYWEPEQSEKERYKDQTADVLNLLLSDPAVELVRSSVRAAPNGEQRFDAEIKRTQAEGKICIKVIPPEKCKISFRTPSWTLDECPYFEYFEEKTISELREMGLDVPDDIPGGWSSGADFQRQEELARDQFNETPELARNDWADPSMRRVTARMIWVRSDQDGDGIAELIYCIRVGNSILYADETPCIDVGVLCPIPLPHRHIGLSEADVVTDVQDIKTAILRQGLDNLYLANNSRTAVGNEVNLDDLLVSQPGGIVRMIPGSMASPGSQIMPLLTPNVFPQAMQGLEYMDSVRESRTGTNRYFTGSDIGSLNRTATGISQLTSSAAQRVEMLTRNFAAGIADFMLKIHGLILRHGRKAQVVKLRNKWVTVDPSQWKTRADMTVAVGVAAGNRQQLAAQIMQTMDAQIKLLQLGITDPGKIYNAVSELTKAQGFPNPDRFWTDPAQQPPREPPPPDPKVMLDAQKLQQDTTIKVQELKLEEQKLIQDVKFREQELMLRARELSANEQTTMAHTQLEREKMMPMHAENNAVVSLLMELRDAMQAMSQNQSATIGLLIEAQKQAPQSSVLRVERQPDGSFIGRRDDGKISVLRVERQPDGSYIGRRDDNVTLQ